MSECLDNSEQAVNVCKKQAEGIAHWANINLTQDQIDLYAELRMISEPGSEALSDQKLLFLILEPEQQEIFDEKLSHIDFESSLDNNNYLLIA